MIRAPMTAPSPADISVVVMGYRNAGSIVDAVESVVTQADAGVEVVVVTSGGDDSAALVRERYPALRVIESASRLLPGGTRNAGIRATGAPIIAFLEADCLARPGWIAGRRAAHGAGHDAVACAVVPASDRLVSWADNVLLYPGRLPSRSAGPVAYPDDAIHGLSASRALLEEIGLFDETVRVGEDTLVAMRLAERGREIWFAPDVCTAQRGPTTVRAMLAQQFRRGRRHALMDPGTALPPGHAPLLAALLEGPEFLAGAAGRAWRTAPGERRTLLLALPLMAAGALARQLGRRCGRRDR